MRMHMINPASLCRAHLLGEHGEIHKHRHNFVKRHSMTKRVELRQIEPLAMASRHDALAAEMAARGMNHKSPFVQPDTSYLPAWQEQTTVDPVAGAKLLRDKCPACRERQLAHISAVTKCASLD